MVETRYDIGGTARSNSEETMLMHYSDVTIPLPPHEADASISFFYAIVVAEQVMLGQRTNSRDPGPRLWQR